MTDEEHEAMVAQTVASILPSPGWIMIEDWLKKHIEAFSARDDATLDNLKVDVLSYEQAGNSDNVKVVVVNLDRDYKRHAARAYKALLDQISDWRNAAGEK